MKEIPLTRGLVAIVDDEDYEILSAFKWRATADGYAVRDIPHPLRPGRKTLEYMHRRILGLGFGDKRQGDHENACRQDNRRENLRIATQAQNQQNKGLSRVNLTGMKGISWHKRDRRWQAMISIGGKAKYLGQYLNADEAHAAYCKAAREFQGEFAKTA